ncbi:MAG: GPP34 family phosphoprotein [Bacteroidales bacterium]|nr:GPP34 family phosphoprotein [Bacteroidales bacterium]MCF8344649.1 GPP34 family phosphoprotein [Bacteroidales bacterium]MCF8350365.1 GPP34 family phosphoprotein [Bacteroidales bacterium]MCF8376262.1 GPP34 family phosphoprotein [Bacteroidales bacterium]MCF8401927.1 GPP34 family phosphoprotein [Bacteroidales bacterium]
MELSLAEKTTLLLIGEKNNRISGNYSGYIIVAACLFDLIRLEKLELKDKRVQVKSHRLPNEELLKYVFEKIKAKEKPKKIKTWISRIGQWSGKIKRLVAGQLEKKRILSIRKKKILGIFPYRTYHLKDVKLVAELKNELLQTVKRERKPDDESYLLLNLLKSGRSMRVVFKNKEDRKQLVEFLKTAEQDSEISKALSDTIKAINAAIAGSVAAAAAVSASSGS